MNGLNTSTYVSLGVLAAIVGATWVLSERINGVKEDMRTVFSAKATALESRVTALENRPMNKETWTDGDMYRWAVHLQKANPNSIKVPEPPMKGDLGGQKP